MTTLEIIVAELQRQRNESRAFDLGSLDLRNPAAAIIDGNVDLVALAAAIDVRREGTAGTEAPTG